MPAASQEQTTTKKNTAKSKTTSRAKPQSGVRAKPKSNGESSKPVNGATAKAAQTKTTASRKRTRRTGTSKKPGVNSVNKQQENAVADVKEATAQAQVDPSVILGQVTWLMVHSPVHKHMFLTDLEWLALPPIQLNQFRIFRKEGKPVAFASWAMLSKEIEQEMLNGRRKLKPHEWRTGDQPWLIDLIAPFGGGDEFLVHLRDEVFKDLELKTIVPGETPGTTSVVSLRRTQEKS